MVRITASWPLTVTAISVFLSLYFVREKLMEFLWKNEDSTGDWNKLTNQIQQFYNFITWCFVSLNMFRAPPRPSSGAYNRINSLWFYRWSVVVAALSVVVWPVNRPDDDQQHCYHHAPTVKPEAVNAIVSSWWWAWRRLKHFEQHKTSSNKLVKLLHLVG